jgi:limonene-1,2-epoxide hydrolase
MISAIEAKDINTAVAFMSEDISYENMPMKPMTGRSVVAKVLQGFLAPAEEVDWQIVSEIEREDTVFNERLDRFKINGQWLELPIAGVFKVRGGKIVLWRDYFDMATYSDQLNKITRPK